MLFRSKFALTGALAAIIATTTPALAVGVLDQSYIAPTPAGATEPNNQVIANDLYIAAQNKTYDFAGLQYVTAGLSGRLTQVDLQLAKILGNTGLPVPFGSGQLILAKNVIIDASGHATGTNVGQLTFNTTAINGFNNWTSFDVSGLNIDLSAGEQFVIAVGGGDNEPGMFRWAYGPQTGYAGGDGYFGVDGTASGNFTWFASIPTAASVPPRDFGFRTWVQAAVPEPGTWLLMIVGFGVIGFSMRRRTSLGLSSPLGASLST